MNRLQGKNVLITGGSSGIGLATAQLFLSEGARVVITGRDTQSLTAAQQALGANCVALRSDAGSLADIEALMEDVRARFTQLDVLFLNAGVAKATPLEQVSEEQFDEMLNVNLKGVFFSVQKALPLLAPGASVIVTTSISGRLASPHFSIYGASKAALTTLVRSLSLSLIERGVRINAISPGPIATPIFDRFGLPEELARSKKLDIERKSPSKRFGMPEEIARAALFLATDDSSYMVGGEMVVDGGMSLI